MLNDSVFILKAQRARPETMGAFVFDQPHKTTIQSTHKPPAIWIVFFTQYQLRLTESGRNAFFWIPDFCKTTAGMQPFLYPESKFGHRMGRVVSVFVNQLNIVNTLCCRQT